MSLETKNIIKVASVYMAAIIGAGFASGQEILQFFSSYYEGGFYGIIFAGILFSVIGYFVLDKVYCERIHNYDEFIFPSLGFFWGWVMEIIGTIFLLTVFCVMVAGSGSILNGWFGISFITGVLITLIFCAAILLSNVKGLMVISTIVTPILIIGILVAGFYIIVYKEFSVFNFPGLVQHITGNWFFSALLYVSYNSIIAVVVLCSMLPFLKTRRVARLGGILGGGMLCFVAFVLNLAIFVAYPRMILLELPVLNILQDGGGFLGEAYSIILWLAMLLSAVTAGYCFINRVSSKIKIDTRIITLVSCALVIPMAGVGFSNLITRLYPLFGYAGLFMIFIILIQGFQSQEVHFLKKIRK